MQSTGNGLAKAVIIKEDDKYSMVIVPSVEHVELAVLRQLFGHGMELATEPELGKLFPAFASVVSPTVVLG